MTHQMCQPPGRCRQASPSTRRAVPDEPYAGRSRRVIFSSQPFRLGSRDCADRDCGGGNAQARKLENR